MWREGEREGVRQGVREGAREGAGGFLTRKEHRREPEKAGRVRSPDLGAGYMRLT